jgi:hypothetical protein
MTISAALSWCAKRAKKPGRLQKLSRLVQKPLTEQRGSVMLSADDATIIKLAVHLHERANGVEEKLF